MQNQWQDWHYVRARQRELIREAEQHRLIARPRRRVVKVYGPALFHVGVFLTQWGQQLQSRYGDLAHPERFRLAADCAEPGGGC
jgi:hypothetical protein